MTQHLTLDGKAYVILTQEEFDELRQIAEDAEDELAGIMAMRRREEAIDRDEHLAMPKEDWTRIRGGESPVRVIREYRGLTQTALADASGVAQPEISAIEGKTRVGTAQTLKRLAKALGAPMDVLVGDD